MAYESPVTLTEKTNRVHTVFFCWLGGLPINRQFLRVTLIGKTNKQSLVAGDSGINPIRLTALTLPSFEGPVISYLLQAASPLF